MDWKKSDRGKAQQHLHLAFKQSNSSIYVYDHGPLSGRYFTVGDRIIDIDGITFIRAADLRDRILWSHHNKVRMLYINMENQTVTGEIHDLRINGLLLNHYEIHWTENHDNLFV